MLVVRIACKNGSPPVDAGALEALANCLEEFDPTVIKLNGGGFLEPHSKNPELWKWLFAQKKKKVKSL